MKRAYSLLTVKAVDEDQRIITGIATTPTADRAGDIVEPEGAEFNLPIPLLWQHDARQPIGEVTEAKVTSEGIVVKARIAKESEPGRLKDRLDEAWQSIKSGLVRGLSIGFKEIEFARIEQTFSYRFIKWLWLELSAVTIPANAEATIQTVKSFDVHLAAPGRKGAIVVRLNPPGATGHISTRSAPEEGNDMKTLAEQITALENKRAANIGAMEAAVGKSLEEGRSTEQSEGEQFDNLEAEVATIDADLKRLRSLERVKALSAKPVIKADNSDDAPAARGGHIVVNTPPKPEPGIRLARYIRCMGLAQKMKKDVERVAQELYGERDPVVVGMIKAAGTAIGALNTTTDTALIGNEGGFADFVEFLRSRTIVNRFGTDGIPALRQIPFRVPLITQATGGTAYWVGEGDGKPLTKPSFSRTELAPLKVAAIAAATMETLRDSSPAAERLIRDDLAAAVVKRLDETFADPGVSAVNGVSPASITNGAESVASTGDDADDISLDARAMMQKFIDSKNPLTSGVWLMSSTSALAVSMMKNPLGQREHPDMSISGGKFWGLPTIVSEYITDYVALVNASDIWIGDEGGISIDMSDQASLQMVAGDDEGSTLNSITPTAAQLVSMWQTNSVAFRAERTINWAKRRPSAVAYLTGVSWGGSVPTA